MTAEQQRIAIAEACGFKNVHRFDKWKEGGPMADGSLIGDKDGVTRRHIPNYPADLNACAEFEKTLSANEANLYRKFLTGLTQVAYIGSSTPQLCYAEHATAPQRCEAFLRTKNLWTDQ